MYACAISLFTQSIDHDSFEVTWLTQIKYKPKRYYGKRAISGDRTGKPMDWITSINCKWIMGPQSFFNTQVYELVLSIPLPRVLIWIDSKYGLDWPKLTLNPNYFGNREIPDNWTGKNIDSSSLNGCEPEKIRCTCWKKFNSRDF